jgi:hypothetical protein
MHLMLMWLVLLALLALLEAALVRCPQRGPEVAADGREGLRHLSERGRDGRLAHVLIGDQRLIEDDALCAF